MRLLAHERKRGEWLEGVLDLSFAPERWQQARKPPAARAGRLNRRLLKGCLFSYLADELRSGDAALRGFDAYADYREHLLSREACEPLRAAYCRDLGFPATSPGFVQYLREWLTTAARAVEAGSPATRQIAIGPEGIPVLRRTPARPVTAAAAALEAALRQRMPERSPGCLAQCGALDPLGPARRPRSGSDPKLEPPVERYILTASTYGCNRGPAQAARHLRGVVTPHIMSAGLLLSLNHPERFRATPRGTKRLGFDLRLLGALRIDCCHDSSAAASLGIFDASTVAGTIRAASREYSLGRDLLIAKRFHPFLTPRPA
jgi:hypothetical protein